MANLVLKTEMKVVMDKTSHEINNYKTNAKIAIKYLEIEVKNSTSTISRKVITIILALKIKMQIIMVNVILKVVTVKDATQE